MSENLSIKINSLHENGFDLKDCSCVFILGSTILNAHIPTKADIFINTTKIADEEILSLIVKHNGQNIVKSFIPVGAIRRDRNYKYKLQPLGVKAEIGSIFTLDMEFSVTIDGQEVGSENKADNPFQQNLYKSETGFTTQDFYASVRPDDLLKNEVERERIINEVRLDRFGVVPIETQSIPYFSPPATSPNTMKAIVSTLEAIEVKPATGGIELRNQADVNNLIQDLKTSVELLEKRIEHKVTEVEDIETGAVEYVEKNFAQSAPIYSTEDFNDREREHHSGNNSPEFGKKEFNRTVPGEINIHEAESYHPIHTLKVPESRGSHVNKWEDHNSDAYLQSGILKGERRNSRQYTETARSAYDDVKIEKNETYMLSMKNQLSSKHISFINDAFTRDIILYMAQSKKKISSVRLRRSITLGPKEEADIDKKEFFNSNCTTKFVHFFQSLSRNLYLYNLVQPFDHIDDTAMKVELNIPFDISPFHKSAITPAGHIFIAGAEADNSNPLQSRGSNTFHVYNYKNRRLLEKPPMLCQSREEFGFCYMSKNLFAIGGVVDGVISNKCERFDVRANKWIKIAPMTRPLREVAVCSFNNRYLYRFFGIDSGNNIDHSIERYDAVRDTWTIMNVSINETAKEIYTPFCTQVNQDCIFLFGGKNINGFAPKTCKGWVLKVEDKRGSNNGALVESKNFIPGLAGTFNGNSVLTHSGDILFLRESY